MYLLALPACFAITAASAAAPQDITGIWYDDSGKGAVEVYPCGPRLCGRIVWLRKATDAAGRPLRDRLNPSARAKQRAICGLRVIGGLAPQSDGTWDGGRIYDPKVGKTYDVAIERTGRNRLQVTGYLGTRLLGRTFNWRRAPSQLPRCTGS